MNSNMLDKEALMNGIDGYIKELGLRTFLENMTLPNNNIARYNEVSKIKREIKKKLTTRLNGIAEKCEINSYWLASTLGADVVEYLGSLPAPSLKYLEQDLIEAIANIATNNYTNNNVGGFSALPASTGLGRVINLFYFLKDYGSTIKYIMHNSRIDHVTKGLSTTQQMVANMEIGKAYNTMNSMSIKPEAMLKRFEEIINDMSDCDNTCMITKKVLNRIIKLADYSGHEDLSHFIRSIKESDNMGVRFISRDKYTPYITQYSICIVVCSYQPYNYYKNSTQAVYKEEDYPKWEVYTQYAIFSFIKTKTTIEISKDNKFSSSEHFVEKLMSNSRISEYGSLENSYKAYKNILEEDIRRMVEYHQIGELLPKERNVAFLESLIKELDNTIEKYKV